LKNSNFGNKKDIQGLSRREFLKAAGGAVATFPLWFAPAGCGLSNVGRSEAGTGLSLGYTAGEVTPNEAIIWLRATPEAVVSVQYGKDPALNSYDATSPLRVSSDSDFALQVALQNLDAGSIYYYRAAVQGKKPGPIARFVTAPLPDDSAKVTFCFSGDTRESYMPFTVMDAVRAQQPDFFLHLGDTIYADRGWVATRLDEFWSKYQANRSDMATERCFAETSCYVVWDDHEVEDNYLPGNPLAPIGRRAFLDYWPIRRNTGEPGRIYRSFRWGQAFELFILDTRQYRDLQKGTMLGLEQKDWLLNRVSSSTALFKFIASPVPMYGGGRDRWDGYPKERVEVLKFIAQKKIPGVVFLSADLHYAGVSRIPGVKGLKEITAGPLAAPLNRITDGTASRFDFFLAENFNFAKITVDLTEKPLHALVEFIDQDNRRFHTTKIPAA
jgi:alkaline phosphatase D